MKTGEVKGIKIKKYLASQMEILEECDATHLKDKVDYWKRYYNYQPDDEDRLKYHFYNKKTHKNLYSVYFDKKILGKYIDDINDYEEVS